MTVQADLLTGLRSRTPEMLDALRVLVEAESPSADLDATKACAHRLAEVGAKLVGVAPELIDVNGRTHVRWRGAGERPVLLLGHFDTVWPMGTVDRWPFAVVRERFATGPGTFDMKAGIVQGLFAINTLGRGLDGIDLLLTSDEELGSPTSRELIEDAARDARAALVLEPSANGSLKVARKGCFTYRVTINGRAAHAGLGPAGGLNALTELAHQVLAVAEIGRGETTVTPTTSRSGTTTNTVPAQATFTVDVRAPTVDEEQRVDKAMQELMAKMDGVEIEVRRTSGRPPLPREAALDLFARAKRIAGDLGLGEIDGVEVGGGSDGNFTAAVGTPTLDGLGAIGKGAHAEGEHIVVERMPERAALVAALIEELLAEDN